MSVSESANPAIPDDPAVAPSEGGEDRPRTDGGAALSWLERVLDEVLVPRGQHPSSWVTQVRRLLGLTEIEDVLSKIEDGERGEMLAAVAKAFDIRFEVNGLENLATVGDRPVIVFANHPIGTGSVLGMSLLLTERFSDHRIIGHRFMKFIRVFSEKLVPVDPFRSTSTTNLESLVKLRREFGTKYQALGLNPAGNSSQLKWSGAISDKPWSDAFIRIARHHDALLVPLWFSGRNRLRYYIASKIRAELAFLALPAEFLRLRGKSITVNIGKPISPDMLDAVSGRRAQLGFLRANVYELERERAMPAQASDPLPPFEKGKSGEGTAGGKPRSQKTNGVRIAQSRAVESVPVGEHLELRFFDAAAAARIEELAGSAGRGDLDVAATHVVLTPRDRLVPCAHWQVLDWGQFTAGDLDHISPLRRAFRLPGDVAKDGAHWLEVVGFAVGSRCAELVTPRQVRMGLRRSAAVSKRASDLVGIVTPQETSFVLAALQFALLQKTRGDAPLLRAGAVRDLIGATQHHDWRPHRDAVGGDRLPDRRRIGAIDPVLRALAGLGIRFGAAGLSADPAPRPCILGRLSLASATRLLPMEAA
jgi:putative hemolysin